MTTLSGTGCFIAVLTHTATVGIKGLSGVTKTDDTLWGLPGSVKSEDSMPIGRFAQG